MTLRLNGSTSGYVELDAPAVAGTTALTLPATSGTVATQAYANTAGGLQLITSEAFSAVSNVSLNGCFTSSFDNYFISVRYTGSAVDEVRIRLRAAGSDATGANYFFSAFSYAPGGTTSVLFNGSSSSAIQINYSRTSENLSFFNVMSPQRATDTFIAGSGMYSGAGNSFDLLASHGLQTAYDGFSLYPDTGTITGTVRVYGYKNGA